MKLAIVRILTLALLLTGLAIAVAASFLTVEGSTAYNFSLTLVLVLFVAGLAVAILWGRCPHCGKHLFVNLLRMPRCPRCGKPLEAEGKYQKKKGMPGKQRKS